MRHFHPKWTKFSVWTDHTPFGYDIVAAAKPKLLVELGTYRGVSYFTFCQSVRDNNLDTLCYAVDTWEGDPHVKLKDPYDFNAFDMVCDHNQTNYKDYSYLLRMSFNEALALFNEESIDLLHIDGLHTYEAVNEDFNNWLPKVKPGGIILLHDIRARLSTSFGVWRFWEECSQKFESYAFNQAYGLGVLRKPATKQIDTPLLNLLFSSNEKDEEDLRKFYAYAAILIDTRRDEPLPPVLPEQSPVNFLHRCKAKLGQGGAKLNSLIRNERKTQQA